MKAVVLTFDRLRLSSLGCYGNLRDPTPNFDGLAARSVVFDRHFGENFDDRALNHAWWTGRYQFPRARAEQSKFPPFTRLLRAAGVATRAIVEESSVAAFPPIPEFDETVRIGATEGPAVPQAETPFARLVQQAERTFDKLSRAPNCLLWLKSRGVPVPWIPPGEWTAEHVSSPSAGQRAVETFLRGGDSEQAETSESNLRLVQDMHAAYVRLLDHWLGVLLEAIERVTPGDELLLIVTSAQGLALGERFRECDVPPQLREEIVHTPLIVQFSGGLTEGSRRQELVQAVDLAPTLLEWFGVETGELVLEGQSLLKGLHGGESTIHQELFLGDGNATYAVRTEEFYCVKGLGEAPEPTGDACGKVHLFVKPEDVWDVHDVAALYPEMVDSLVSRLDEFIACVNSPA